MAQALITAHQPRRADWGTRRRPLRLQAMGQWPQGRWN